jgi:tRNA A-37 threonylcarbamoyl transferase component Bud32
MIKLIEKLHGTGYLHLDLKSNNLLFGPTEIPQNLNSE